MSWVEILLLAFALSIDACVVSFSYGLGTGLDINRKKPLLLAGFTGVFQALMPLLGGLCTNCVQHYIEPYAKWIVFVIFFYLGVSFIKESFSDKKEVKDLTLTTLFLIAIATSIDAFSAGITLSLKLDSIIIPIILIGVVTFINSLVGFYTGKTFKQFNPKYLEILGGLILIALAIKVIL